MNRKYSVKELDELRELIEHKYIFGTYSYSPPPDGEMRVGRSYYEQEKDSSVERMMRTHMLAGHTAADLLASEIPADTESHRLRARIEQLEAELAQKKTAT